MKPEWRISSFYWKRKQIENEKILPRKNATTFKKLSIIVQNIFL